MDLKESYQLLQIPETADNDAISRAFKKLAHKYHPDKNRDRVDWANNAMKKLNSAYSLIMSSRFIEDSFPGEEDDGKAHGPVWSDTENLKEKEKSSAKKNKHGPYNYYENVDNSEFLINKFVKERENAKDSLYRFFQYNLFNIIRREKPSNMGIFNRIVFSLRKSYHSIKKLAKQTEDPELLEHFKVFSRMIFNFYRASECLNVIDSYSNQTDVNAFRLFKFGDEALHAAHSEVFFERHNRGSFRQDIAQSNLLKAIQIFKNTIRGYPSSSWIVETKIKLEYALSLKNYLDLFFTE
jgi:curved DNA-binding protein CbpA